MAYLFVHLAVRLLESSAKYAIPYIAYAKGLCDDELNSITNDNSMFKQQARYLIKRRENDLWAQVLVHDNVHLRALID